MTQIDQTKLSQFESLDLKTGAHSADKAGVKMCAMEAAAWLANEPHSDKPQCVCPVIASFMRSYNDKVDDETRQLLKPYVVKVLNTKSTKEDEVRRGFIAADYACRVFAPYVLEKKGLADDAAKLRALTPIVDKSTAYAANAAANAAYAAANAAANAAYAAANAAYATYAAANAATYAAADAAAWPVR